MNKIVKNTLNIIYAVVYAIIIVLFCILLKVDFEKYNYIFFLFLILILFLFLIEPFIKLKYQSAKRNILFIVIYLFLSYFIINYSAELFFISIIPVISGAINFGIKGSGFTAVAIFFLNNCKYLSNPNFNLELDKSFIKYIALFITALITGFIFEENSKVELRCYENFSKISNFKDLRLLLNKFLSLNDAGKEIYLLLKKLFKIDCGLLILKSKENYCFIVEDSIKIHNFNELPILNKITSFIINNPAKFYKLSSLESIKSILKINFSFEEDKEFIALLMKRKKYFTLEEFEFSRIIKNYIDILLENYNLNIMRRKKSEYFYSILKNIPTPIIILNNNFDVIFTNDKLFEFLEFQRNQHKIEIEWNNIFNEKIVKEILNNDIKIYNRQLEITTYKKIKKIILLTKFFLVDVAAGTKNIILLFTDLTEQKKMESHLLERDKIISTNEINFYYLEEIFKIVKKLKNIFKELKSETGFTKLFIDIDKEFLNMEQFIENFNKVKNKIDTGFKLLNIIDIIENLLNNFKLSIKFNKITFNKVYFKNECFIIGNERELNFAFLSIFNNAAEAVKDKGIIMIQTRIVYFGEYKRKKTYIEIKISDDGIGIIKDDISNIFQPFYCSGKESLGLGLTITKNIIERHNGKIQIKSIINKGTIVTVLLPVEFI